jgi:hypothetical protein
MMSDYSDDFENLEAQASSLTDSLGQASLVVSTFDTELRRMQESLSATGQDMASLERGMSRGLRKAFDGLIFDGIKLSDALETVAQTMINTAYNAALKPVANQVGGLLANGLGDIMKGLFPFEDGAAFSQGRVVPFANGGIVSSPTYFPMRGAAGLMGEAGPEAIMPLARGPDGKLGVRGAGGGPTVVMNITTPDVQGFNRSRSQIAAQMSRALGRSDRNT